MRNSTDRATLHDVAALVGVSPRTVSRVVNDEGGFSEATRRRVLEAVAELQYHPNALARGLITNRTNTVALIVPLLSDPFFPEVAEGVQRAALASGLTVLLAVTDSSPALQSEILSSLEGQRPDGLIIFPAGEDGTKLVPHLDRGMRMVLIDSHIDHVNAASVSSDLRAGAKLAVEQLLADGRTKLAMIANEGSPHNLRRRHDGFVAALPGGMEVIVERVAPTIDGGRHTAIGLLEEHPDIDGIFTYNDIMAIGAIQGIQSTGRTVPDDVAVIGCDDIAMGSVVTPSLSTVRIDRERLGTEAVRMLVALLAGEPTGSPQTLPIELISRGSG